jgi:diguanylate cyclase (GGDEF)-like protein
LAVLFIDLDGFENVNNTHGHSVGDALLEKLGNRLRDNLGNSVRLAHLGNDEFAILQAPCAQPEGAVALAGRIIELIKEPYRFDGYDLSIGASIGIAVNDGDRQDAEFLLNAADLAMYRAQADGGGTYRLFDPQIDAASQSTPATPLPASPKLRSSAAA